jgi:hypothetical protein
LDECCNAKRAKCIVKTTSDENVWWLLGMLPRSFVRDDVKLFRGQSPRSGVGVPLSNAAKTKNFAFFLTQIFTLLYFTIVVVVVGIIVIVVVVGITVLAMCLATVKLLFVCDVVSCKW